MVGATIDQTGMPALTDFVQRFHPGFVIGAMDPAQVATFGQYGPMMRTFVPMIYFIDKTGKVQAQFQGSDEFFQGDQKETLRKQIARLMGAAPGGAPPAKPAPANNAKPAAPATKK